MPDVRIPEQEERRPPRQCNSKKGKFIAASSQGSCRIQRSGAGSESPEPKLLPKFIGCAQAVSSWLKRIGYMFAKQFYWYKLSWAFSNLGVRAFQLSHDRFPLFLTGCILIGWPQVAWWGQGILPIRGKPKLRSGPPVMVLALAASLVQALGFKCPMS